MLNQNDEDCQNIIGEAVLHIALNDGEICVRSLLEQLNSMARQEESAARLALIDGATRWLKGFLKSEHAHRSELHWIVQSARGYEH